MSDSNRGNDRRGDRPPFGRIRRLVDVFFGQSTVYAKTTRTRFAEFAGCETSDVIRALKNTAWKRLREEWLLRRLRQMITDASTTARVKQDFAAARICKTAGVARKTFYRLAGPDYIREREALPTGREKVLAAIRQMVDGRVSPDQLTVIEVYKRAGVRPPRGPWLYEALRQARLEAIRRVGRSVDPPAGGGNIRVFERGWIDLDSDCWDFTFCNKGRLRRSALRSDIAEVAWAILKQEAGEADIQLSTIISHYYGFRWAGELLGSEVKDIREATLGRVQRAWARGIEGRRQGCEPRGVKNHHPGRGAGLSAGQRKRARQALLQLFMQLDRDGRCGSPHGSDEIRKILAWLYLMASPPREKQGGIFLTEGELEAVLRHCLKDIGAGIEYMQKRPGPLSLSGRARTSNTAGPVVNWGAGLIILLMVFTGLRRGSLIALCTGDWRELRRGLYGLAWKHDKKNEEGIALIPGLLARQLDVYAAATKSLRDAIGTDRLFLNWGGPGCWIAYQGGQAFDWRITEFVKRHGLRRDGRPMVLTSNVLRRTYTTQQLYKGRSIRALQMQLGHTSIRSTLAYSRHDLYEHPAQVIEPLDGYARRVLRLWPRPALLEELDANERMAVVSARRERDQQVELCRQSSCVKAEQGAPPPCSLCEHLVTGEEFLGAWQAELSRRERELASLNSTGGAAYMMIQAAYQLDHFTANYNHVIDSLKEGGAEID